MANTFFSHGPKFEIEQLIAASEAARNFSTLRKNAKISPRLILENNKPDSILMNIEDYTALYQLMDALEEEITVLRAAIRIHEHDTGTKTTVNMEDVVGTKNLQTASEWDISDVDLFE